MRAVPILSIVCACIGLTIPGRAVTKPMTIRYALIIGNNSGTDETGHVPLSPLLHAERDAARVERALIENAHFDPTDKRTILLLRATSAEVDSAVAALVAQKAKDIEMFQDVRSLFLFYFSGHGIDGRLLLDDGVLSAEAVGALFTAFDATFSLAIFDACFAGSMGDAAFRMKRIDVAEGFDPLRRLPNDVLTANGRIWFVSSDAEGESFEDERLGGVFTHFFIEAMERAERDDLGISVDRIWEYAREKTVSYTTARHRPQYPERYIAKLRSGAPIYLSFPSRRSASLSLSTELSGRFALVYSQGHHTEILEKGAGQARMLSIYPGALYIQSVEKKRETTPPREVTLRPGDVLRLRHTARKAAVPVGTRAHDIAVSDSAHSGGRLLAETVRAGLSILVGLGYGMAVANPDLLQSLHNGGLPMRFDYRQMVVKAAVSAGYASARFPSWQYALVKVGGSVTGGIAVDLDTVRLDATVGVGGYWLRQTFETAAPRVGAQLYPHISAGGLFPRQGPVLWELCLNGGFVYTPGIGIDATNQWGPGMGISLSVYHRFF